VGEKNWPDWGGSKLKLLFKTRFFGSTKLRPLGLGGRTHDCAPVVRISCNRVKERVAFGEWGLFVRPVESRERGCFTHKAEKKKKVCKKKELRIEMANSFPIMERVGDTGDLRSGANRKKIGEKMGVSGTLASPEVPNFVRFRDSAGEHSFKLKKLGKIAYSSVPESTELHCTRKEHCV